MQNYVESLFDSLKKGCFAKELDAELLKKLRTAFIYGMDAGYQLTSRAPVSLSNNQTVEFFQNLEHQIDGSLRELNLSRARVKVENFKLKVN